MYSNEHQSKQQSNNTEVNQKSLYNQVVYFETISKDHPSMTLWAAQAFLYVAQKPGIGMREVESKLGRSSSAVSRMIASLCKTHRAGIQGANLIRLEEDPLDRRYKIVHLTEKGRHLMHRLVERYQP